MVLIERFSTFLLKNAVFVFFIAISHIFLPFFYKSLSWWGFFSLFTLAVIVRDKIILSSIAINSPTKTQYREYLLHKQLASDGYLKSPFKK